MVIGILAAITIVAYNGISGRAKIATLQSDTTNAARALALWRVGTSTSDQYPTANDCSASPAVNTICLKASSGNSVVYQVNNSTSPPSFCVMVTNGTVSYEATSDSSAPIAGNCPGVLATGISCPINFIVVPGSSTFGTSDFCVMKYEAKQASATVPVSQATGIPWGDITQTNAATYSTNVAGCAGCHLISEAEWMTIAQNVLGVASNWSGNAVGTGYIYSGHNDDSPSGPLAASSTDTDGYSGTGNNAPSNQRRTLMLSNGEVIWDLSGNTSEWTSGTINSGQQPGLSGETAYAWKQWNNGSLLWNGLPTLSRPSAMSGAAATYSSTQGIGQLFSNYADTSTRGFNRGGTWNHADKGGVLSLILSDSPSVTHNYIGFRVAK